jgi:hypothetical protein
LSYRREVDATRKLATRVLVLLVRRISGAFSALPTIVTVVSNIRLSQFAVSDESTRQTA